MKVDKDKALDSHKTDEKIVIEGVLIDNITAEMILGIAIDRMSEETLAMIGIDQEKEVTHLEEIVTDAIIVQI